MVRTSSTLALWILPLLLVIAATPRPLRTRVRSPIPAPSAPTTPLEAVEEQVDSDPTLDAYLEISAAPSARSPVEAGGAVQGRGLAACDAPSRSCLVIRGPPLP